eukprot:TRINITY_DN21438_c0_g1_i1.p1 TRINITY_DN21438_c0_g1~~TRINITY_DN21438_c0_g1_i1.p1  ORF type:complete len:559 (+),score=124.38 TRINITY_DN21438_c0_g1_i1:226-1677(+)
MDEADFLSKAEARCDRVALLSPMALVEALNAEPVMRVKDSSHRQLLQISLDVQEVRSFRELQGVVRARPGSACGIAELTTGRTTQLAAVYREAYGDRAALVARAAPRGYMTGLRPSTQAASLQVAPLLSFGADQFKSAALLDPVIVRALRYENGANGLVDLQVPPIKDEFLEAEAALSGGGPAAEGAANAARVCGALAALSAPAIAGGVPPAAASASARLAVELMGRHLADSSVQVEGCRALRGYLPHCAHGDAVAHDALETVAAAMRRHIGASEVQEAACAALAGPPLAGDAELQSAASSQGIVQQVAGAMRSFPDDAGVQTWSCAALASLAASHPMNQASVAGARGVELLVTALEKHQDDTLLLTMACGALGNLAANHGNNRAAIAAAGGLERLTGAMRRHEDAPEVQQAAIGAAWCLATDCPEVQAIFTRLGGRDLIVAAVKRFQGDEGIRAVATGALQVLVPGLGEAIANEAGQRRGGY